MKSVLLALLDQERPALPKHVVEASLRSYRELADAKNVDSRHHQVIQPGCRRNGEHHPANAAESCRSSAPLLSRVSNGGDEVLARR